MITATPNHVPFTADALRRAALDRYVDRRLAAAEVTAEDDPDVIVERHHVGSPLDLLRLARLARAVSATPDPAALARPGHVVLLRVEDLVASATASLVCRDLVPVLAARAGLPVPDIEIVHGLGWSKRRDLDNGIAAEDLASALLKGDVVLVCMGAEKDSPDVVASLVDVEIAASDLTAADIRGVFAATARTGWDAPDLLAQLPDDAALAMLEPVQLVHAFGAADAEGAAGVVRRLRAAAAWSAAQGGGDETPADPDPDETDGREIPALRLAGLHGLGPAGDLLRCLANNVADWRAGHLNWSDVGASVLLSGPPGCGKTSTAAALAGEIGGPIIDLSYTRMQAAGHMGRMLATLDKGVARAKSQAPCVALIDEVDDLSDRAGGADPFAHNARYMRSTVNAYLVRLGELATTPGVVVVLATNHAQLVDPALVRAGRVDHRVTLSLPDRDALGAILAQNLVEHATPDLRNTPAWSAALDALTGRSGAEAAKMAREIIAMARSRMRRERAAGSEGTRPTVTADDLSAVAVAADPRLVAPDLRRLAIHEAGHILAAHVLGRPRPIRAWIGPQGAGVTAPVEASYTAATAHAELAALLAGREAERAVLGDVSSGAGAGGAESDLAKATLLAASIATEWHLETPADAAPLWRTAERHVAAPDWSDRRAADAVDRLLAAAQARAADLVRRHPGHLTYITDALLRDRDLDGPAIAALLDRIERDRPAPVDPADDRTRA